MHYVMNIIVQYVPSCLLHDYIPPPPPPRPWLLNIIFQILTSKSGWIFQQFRFRYLSLEPNKGQSMWINPNPVLNREEAWAGIFVFWTEYGGESIPGIE